MCALLSIFLPLGLGISHWIEGIDGGFSWSMVSESLSFSLYVDFFVWLKIMYCGFAINQGLYFPWLCQILGVWRIIDGNVNWILKVRGSYVGIITLNILVWKSRKSSRESKSHFGMSKGRLEKLNIMGFYCFLLYVKSYLLQVSFGSLYKAVL